MTNPKEPHFFAPDYSQPWDGKTYSKRSDYDALFDGVNAGHQAVGEASTNYLWSDVAIASILQENPDARFIVCLRDPVAMVRSMHQHHVFWAIDTEPCLRTAWSLNHLRGEGHDVPPWSKNPRKLNYAEACSVGTQLERLYDLVPESQIHVVFLEDLSKDPEQTYKGVTTFLGATPSEIIFGSKNITRKRRSNLLHRHVRALRHHGRGVLPWRLIKFVHDMNEKWNNSEAKPEKKRLDRDLEDDLRKFFTPQVEIIERLTSRNLSHWK